LQCVCRPCPQRPGRPTTAKVMRYGAGGVTRRAGREYAHSTLADRCCHIRGLGRFHWLYLPPRDAGEAGPRQRSGWVDTLCRWRPAVGLFWPFRLTVRPKVHGPRHRPGGRRLRSPQWRACRPGRSSNTRADAESAASHPVRDRCFAHPRTAFGYDVLLVRS